MKKQLEPLVSKMEWKFALKGALAAGISLLLGQYVSFLFKQNETERLVGGLWTAVAALIASQAHLGTSFRAGGMRILGTVIGAAVGTSFAFFFGTSPLIFGICIFFTFIFCNLLGLQTSISLAGATVAVMMTLTKIHEVAPIGQFALFRIIDSCMGVLVAISIAYLIWPQRATTKMHQNMAKIFESLYSLYQTIALKKEDKEFPILNQDLEQKFTENRMFLKDMEIELLLSKSRHAQWKNLNAYSYKIYDLLLTLEKMKLPIEPILTQISKKAAALLRFLPEGLLKPQKSSKGQENLKKVQALKDELAQLDKNALQMNDDDFYLWLHLHRILLEAWEGSHEAIEAIHTSQTK
jgi:uncharacterized membrane protein YgaE (UPF0421/DUF939 family)